MVQCPRLTCGGHALLFVIAGSLRIDLFQHANPRPRQVRAGRGARLLALRVLLALSAGPTGATRQPCRPARLLGGHSRVRSARCGLCGPILGGLWAMGGRDASSVVGHCNAVNNHLDDVGAVWRASGCHTMALGSYGTALGWLGSENSKSSIRVFSTIISYAPVPGYA